MTNKEIEKYNQELTECSKSLSELRMIGDSGKKHPDLKKLYQRVQTLATEVSAPLSNASILSIERTYGPSLSASIDLEGKIGELINNIHNALQTKMMYNACIFAKWSCLFAAAAATIACISVILTMCLN
ncbi:MAG: hypothetical protein CVV39_02535 [Planctomycetes bacterium HGW-Planctomycetes-1]|nr:MAG: hypothetical protein CVV39_02535 [Planctomycetes bacterium HGW-Planctomycetes-1]